MLRLAACFVLLAAVEAIPPKLASTNETAATTTTNTPDERSSRTAETQKKKTRDLPPGWWDGLAASVAIPPRIDRVIPDPGAWVVGNVGLAEIQIGFTEPVTTPPDSVFVWKIDLTQIADFTTSYDSGTNTLTITFVDAIRDTRLNVLLDFTITNVGGNELDGEIDDPSNPTLPSGDGFRGGQAVLRFNILQGDANRDGFVDQADATIIRDSLGLDENDAGFNPLADLNLDGVVNVLDSVIFREAEGRTIPQSDGDPPVIIRIFEPSQSVFEPFDTVTIELSEAVVPLHLSERSGYLIDANGNIHVPTFYGQSAFGDVLDFFFIPPIDPCGTYTINLTNGMADVSGELIMRPANPPIITGIVPPPAPVLDSHTTSTTDTTVSVSGSAPGASSVEVGGPEGMLTVPVTGGAFTVDVPLAANKVNSLFFTALSECDGIRSPPTRTAITRDNQAPNLFIDFPADGASITTNTTDVAGRVGDLLSGYLGLQVQVQVRDAQGTLVTPIPIVATVNVGIGNNGTYFAPAVPLAASQDNTIEVTATDQLSNAITRQITVTQSPVPPSMEQMVKVSGNGQSDQVFSTLDNPIVIQVFDDDGVTPLANKWVTFQVTRSDGKLAGAAGYECMGSDSLVLQCKTDATGQVAVRWTLGGDAGEGNNRVRATATEVMGTVEFCATATAGSIKQINVGSGHNQFVEVNAPAPQPLRAWVNDACNGNCRVPVTFTVAEGNGIITGNTSPLPCSPSDEPVSPNVQSGTSITVYTSRTGHAEVQYTAGSEAGASRIRAGVAGLPTPATFVVYGVERDPNVPTSFTGLVLDNGSQPIQGADCELTINGTVVGTTVSGLDGQFRFDNIPDILSGSAGLTVDGFPATHIGGYPGVDVPTGSFPSLHYETVVIPNAENSLPTPVRLPRLDECNRFSYSQVRDTVLTIRRRNPNVSDSDDSDYCLPAIEGLKFIVQAGSMTIDGQPAPEGSLLMLNQVHHDDIPMPLPDGAAPPFAGTLWPPNARFDPPIAIEYPNMSGLPPGAIAYFLSYDHDTAKFEIVGTGSVVADGSLIVTDPGSGIPHGGWHCNCPPYSVTGECEFCDDDPCCNDRCCQGSDCCGDPDPCCDANDPCCGNPNRCCNPDNPCCGSPDPCCNLGDPCCGNPNRCCNPDNPCCGSSDPCCNSNDPCCGSFDACCNSDNPCCVAALSGFSSAAGDSFPCCDDADACCNDPDPCCGVNCDDGNPCTQATCVDGVCQHPCLGDCVGCQTNRVCFDCACTTASCSFQVENGDACPGGEVKLKLNGSCRPDCGPMTFSMEKSVQDLDVTLPASITCDGNMHQRLVKVKVDEEAEPGSRQFRIIGTTSLTDCDDFVTVNIVECVKLTFDGVSDADELDPGGFLCVNDDDDNNDGTPDKGDSGPTIGEDDLEPLTLSIAGGWGSTGIVTLKCTAGCSRVKFYENPDRSNPFSLPISWSVPHPDLPKTLYVEGINKSLAARDVKIEAEFTGPGGPCKDIIKLTVVQVDLDVDSDNTNASPDFGPQRNQAEDNIEDKDDRPGRIVWVNNNDDDRDNVADFGDGYNLDAANANDDANSGEKSFVRLVFEVPPSVDLTQAQLRITYNASDPAGAAVITTPPNVAPAPGNLRIWTKNGNQVRNSGVIPTGDYVAPGSYDPVALGLSNAARRVNLWLEGIRPSSMIGNQRILFEFDPDGPSGPAGFCRDAVRVTVSQIEILTWDAASTSMTLADHADIGHWGEDRATNELSGYGTGLTGTVINAAGGTFIDMDPDRFSVRLTHHPGNMDPAVAEAFIVQVGTLTETGAVDDSDHNITLLETGPGTGIFLSETQLLAAPDLSMVVGTDQDDGFAVYLARTMATVADEADNDRTHKATINGHLRVTYTGLGGNSDLTVPVCDRVTADLRRIMKVRVTVLNEPFDDFGLDGMPGTGDFGEGNGTFDFQDFGADGIPGTMDSGEGDGLHTPGEPHEPFTDISGDASFNTVLGPTAGVAAIVDAQIDRATIAWAQACIKVEQTGATRFLAAPAPGGTNIIADGFFDVTDNNAIIADSTHATGVLPDIAELYFVGEIRPFFNAFTNGPVDTGFGLPAIGANTYMFIGIPSGGGTLDIRFRTVAHEIGHALDNILPSPDGSQPLYVFYPAGTTSMDDTVATYRRIRNDTETNSRIVRPPGAANYTMPGNTLLSNP